MNAMRFLLGLSLGALSLGGCARNLCDSEPNDPRCAAIVTPVPMVLTASPMRVSMTAGTQIAVEVNPAPKDGLPVLLRRAGAKDLTLGMLQGGKLKVTVVPADLSFNMFTPGAAQLAVQLSAQSELTLPLRLYLDPQFTQPAKEYDTKADMDTPTWVGIGKGGLVYALNLFPPFVGATDRKQRLVDYQYMAGPTPQADMLSKHMPVTFGGYKVDPFSDTAPARAVLTANQVIVASLDKGSTQFPLIMDVCQFATAQCTTVNPTTFTFKAVSALSTDAAGGLFAVQSDAGTLAYRASDMNPFASKLELDNADRPTPGIVVAVAAGDVDGDGQPDVVTFESTPPGASVFLRQSDGNKLRYAGTVSAKLKTLLGQNPPAAVTIADMDADGLGDIVMARDGAVSVLFNQGDGSFTAAMQLAALTGVDSVAVGVLHMGGGVRMDLAMGSSSGQRVAVLINQATF